MDFLAVFWGEDSPSRFCWLRTEKRSTVGFYLSEADKGGGLYNAGGISRFFNIYILIYT